eukprot:1478618-Ditylum_brightwellii.AAC.1
MKEVQYRSCMCWKVMGITNPEFWDFTVKPPQVLDPEMKTNLSLEKRGSNKILVDNRLTAVMREKGDIGSAQAQNNLPDPI